MIKVTVANLRSALLHEVRLFFVALQFLTRVPVPRWVGFKPDWLHHCVRYFALVGAVVGMMGATVLWLAVHLWPSMVAVVLAMAATVWLTGGFHEDGLADTVDGLGGAVSRERALAIMKDSRLGSYGALALVLVLGLKAALLVSLLDAGLHATGHPFGAMLAMTWAHTLSRVAPVLLIRWLPYAGDIEHAKAKPLATRVSGWGWSINAFWPVLLGLGVLAITACGHGAWTFGPSTSRLACMLGLSSLGAGLSTVWCARWFKRRLGGYTGDTLGATQQFAELACLLGWLALYRL